MKEVVKYYGTMKAVDNLTLSVAKGERFAFLGPNAAGKTTTIKLLTGLLKPTRGEISIGGFDITRDYIRAKSLIGYVPDIPYVYEKITPRELIRFVLDVYRMYTRDKVKEAEWYLEQFELIDYADTLIQTFSHGMRQKMVFTCAFIHDPCVIILDEPMVGLDPYSKKLIKDMIRKKSAEGATIFMSTHTLADAEELATRMAIVNRGRVVADGSLEELRRRNASAGDLEEIFLRMTREESSKI